ncbi:hypothetical protein CTI12_AA596770 [Artemisia annua]|uniref:Uncharacterized protein n=1 Tax=Artemisia annua TaxID=35608 RepID=A0A2U1KIY7_ARTAN|nr:hypothetical protein CTI12_AA596770 [Artemisia annua]
MGDQLPHNPMNLDLNMVPNDHSHTMGLDDWLLGSMRDVVSQRMRLTGDEQASKIVKTSEKSREESSFFECNICLDLASEPLVYELSLPRNVFHLRAGKEFFITQLTDTPLTWSFKPPSDLRYTRSLLAHYITLP